MYICSFIANNPNVVIITIIVTFNLLFMLFGGISLQFLSLLFAFLIKKIAYYFKLLLLIYLIVVIGYASYEIVKSDNVANAMYADAITHDTVLAVLKDEKMGPFVSEMCRIDSDFSTNSPLQPVRKCIANVFFFCDELNDSTLYMEKHGRLKTESDFDDVSMKFKNVVFDVSQHRANDRNDDGNEQCDPRRTYCCTHNPTNDERHNQSQNLFDMTKESIMNIILGNNMFIKILSRASHYIGTVLLNLENNIMRDGFYNFAIPPRIEFAFPNQVHSSSLSPKTCIVDFLKNNIDASDCYSQCHALTSSFIKQRLNNDTFYELYAKFSQHRYKYYDTYIDPRYVACNDNDDLECSNNMKIIYDGQDYASDVILSQTNYEMSTSFVIYSIVSKLIPVPETVIRFARLIFVFKINY
jgi:hypothetical protein